MKIIILNSLSSNTFTPLGMPHNFFEMFQIYIKKSKDHDWNWWGGEQINCIILYRHCASFNVILRMCNSYFLYKALSGSFMVDMGFSSNIIWSPPLPNVTWHSGTWSSIVTPLTDKTLHQFLTYQRTGPYYQCLPYYQISRGFHRTLQWVRLANRGRLLLRTPGPVPFGTCIFF